ncbi:MAG: hypothetical protein GY839_14690 [candidate division Zixibacteria bacterium]|nr:hypothetical protein [candidate division Zixibacteria bacterium]
MYGLTHRLAKKIFISAILIILLSCGRDETIINNTIVEEPNAYVIGEIGPRYDHYNVVISIMVTNTFTIPEVLVNDTPIDIYGYADLGIRYYENDFVIDEGDSLELVVSYAKQDGAEGFARAGLIYPGPFELIGFNEDAFDTIYVGDDFNANWTSSEGSDRYVLDGWFSYLYQDTLGQSHGVNYYIDTTILDTSLFLPASTIFPNEADITDILTGGAEFSVYGVSGPVNPGENSNISGDGSGFVYARNRTRLVDFEILD